MIDLNKVRKARGVRYVFNEKPNVDAVFVKKLRKKLNMSQSMFASLLNVSNKTIEKWEQGKNPVSAGSAVAMIIFNDHPEIVKDFIIRKDYTVKLGETFVLNFSKEEYLSSLHKTENYDMTSNSNRYHILGKSVKCLS